MDILEFRQRLLSSLFNNSPEIPQYVLKEADWQQIRDLAESRYFTWEWNYGRSPDFNVQKVHRFDFGEIDARINVSRGVIESIRFFGDFQPTDDVADLEAQLVGVRYEPATLQAALETVDLSRYFAGISGAELAAFLY
jgi:lipoate-protein ligase A